MVSEVSRDLKVKRVKMVFQVSKVTWVLKEIEEKLVKWVQEEKMALKDPKVEQVQLETLVLLVKQEKRGNLVFQDYQDIQEDKVQRISDVPGSTGFPGFPGANGEKGARV